MISQVSLVVYDGRGVVRQISHIGEDYDLSREEIVGTHVSEWGDANVILSDALFSHEPCNVADIHWEKSGYSGTTRVLAMPCDAQDTAVTLAVFHARTWELTNTEYLTIRRVSEGMTIPQIAEDLNISVDGVKSAIIRVRNKTGASTRCQAVAICCHCGII